MTRRGPQHGIRRMLVGTAALAVVGATIGVAPASAGGVSAVDITVTTTSDGGPGSLREAVNEVAVNASGGPHTIRLAAGETYELTICGDEEVDEDLNTEGDLDVVDALTIIGNGATIEQTCPAERVLHNVTDTHLQLQDVTITGGSPELLDAPTIGRGGGVWSFGSLTLQSATFTGNTSQLGGGVAVDGPGALTIVDSTITDNATGNGGGAWTSGSAVVRGSTVSRNEASGNGGALDVEGDLVMENSIIEANTSGSDGAGVNVDGDATISGSVIADNETDEDFGYGGGVYVTGALEMTSTTVRGNSAAEDGGGIDVVGSLTLTRSLVTGNTAGSYGGGIYTGAPGSQISDSTISGNTAGVGGGVHIDNPGVVIARSLVSGNSSEGTGGGIHSYYAFTVTNSTIDGNTAAEGGGIGMDGDDFRPTLDHVTLTSNSAPTGANISPGFGVVHATVVADPQGGGDNCAAGAETSAGYNVEVGTDTCGFAGTGDVASGPDPLLGALGDNGGPTHTRLPLDGSPLIDAVPADSDGCGGTDQRSVDRPQFAGCDVGAVEVAPDPPPPAPPAGSPGAGGAGSNRGATPTAPAAQAVAARPTFTG